MVFPLVSEGRMKGWSQLMQVHQKRREKRLGMKARDKGQRMKTESKRLSHNCLLLVAYVEIFEDTNNFLCNTDEKTETQNKV